MNKSLRLLAVVGLVIVTGPTIANAQTPISGCQTISQPGSYVFVGNIDGFYEGGPCIVVGASAVTIDFNGFELRGPIHNAAIKTSSGSVVDLTVRNGSIMSLLATGITTTGSGMVVDHLTIATSGTGLNLGPGAMVTNSSVNCSIAHESGLDCIDTGAGSRIVNNNVSGPCDDGFSERASISAGSDSTLIQNLVTNPCAVDVAIEAGAGSILRGNVISGGWGPFLVAGAAILTNNVATGAYFNDFIVGANSLLLNNNASGSKVGFDITCPANVLFNTALNNGQNLSETAGATPCNNFQNLAP